MQLLKKISKLTTKRAVLQIAVVAVALVVLEPRFREFLRTPLQLHDLAPVWLIVSLLGLVISFVCAAHVYVSLLKPKLHYQPALAAQIATSFTNRLLPGGIGGMGTYVRFLHTQKVSAAQSAVIVGANQLIGIISFVLVALSLGLTARQDQIRVSVSVKGLVTATLVIVLIILLLIVASAKLPRIGKKLRHFFDQVWHSVLHLLRQPTKTTWALISTLGITLGYTMCLYGALRAVGIDIELRYVLIIYMGGSVAASVAPTPGGLGPVEAALVAGLDTIGVAPSPAVSGVLLYRVVSFWLPIIPGYVAFRWLLKRKYL